MHTDADHNRSVFTLVGSEDELADALVAGVRVAAERIDLRAHDGAHPRIGAADVVPIVPLLGDGLERAQAAAALVGRRIGEELALPVFVYAPARARAGLLPPRRACRAAAAHRRR